MEPLLLLDENDGVLDEVLDVVDVVDVPDANNAIVELLLVDTGFLRRRRKQ